MCCTQFLGKTKNRKIISLFLGVLWQRG